MTSKCAFFHVGPGTPLGYSWLQYSWLLHKDRLCALEEASEQSMKKQLVRRPAWHRYVWHSSFSLGLCFMLQFLSLTVQSPERWFLVGCFHTSHKKTLIILWGCWWLGEKIQAEIVFWEGDAEWPESQTRIPGPPRTLPLQDGVSNRVANTEWVGPVPGTRQVLYMSLLWFQTSVCSSCPNARRLVTRSAPAVYRSPSRASSV